MTMKVTKAIVPVAGWGTRMLPITKSIEKCMLPIGTRPVIDFIVQDAIKAGITDIYFVVGEQSSQLQSYYRSNILLNDYLKGHGKADKLPLVAPLKGVSIHFITQSSSGGYGTSVPIGLVNEHIADDESAIVVMGDQFMYRTDGGSNTAGLIELAKQAQSTAGLFGVSVPEEDVSKYGIIDKDANNNFVRIVEKPTREEAPSNLINLGFYLLPKRIFELATMLPVNPARGEYELTDAINAYIAEGNTIVVGAANGQFLDGGSVEGWLHANNVVCGAKEQP